MTVTSEDVVNACYLFFNYTFVNASFSKYVNHISAPSMFYSRRNGRCLLLICTVCIVAMFILQATCSKTTMNCYLENRNTS